MRHTILSLASIIFAFSILTQCSNDSSVSIVQPKTTKLVSIIKPAVQSSIVTPTVATANVSGKIRDRHGLPVYTFGEKNRVARTTAYTCSEEDHLIYGSKNAVGSYLKYNDRVRSAAADWSFYPVGTVFKIKGLPYLYVIDDYGSALTGTGTIDIYHPNKAMMNQWGTRNVEINVVKWGSLEQSAGILSKRTGYSHCRQMYTNIQRIRGTSVATASR
jgi:3D (Asp-Asp-Asp) domain-containing protein